MILETIGIILLSGMLAGLTIAELKRVLKDERHLIRPRLNKRTYPKWIR